MNAGILLHHLESGERKDRLIKDSCEGQRVFNNGIYLVIHREVILNRWANISLQLKFG